MSKYNPSALSAADIRLANVPELGKDVSTVYLSYDPFSVVKQITQTGNGAGAFDPLSNAYAIPSAGLDLVIVCDNAVASDIPITISLNVTNHLDANTTANVTLAAPSFVADQSNNFPLATAADFTLTTNATHKVKAILGINSISGGAVGNRYLVCALPDAASYFAAGCIRGVEKQLPFSTQKNVPCGSDPNAYILPGMRQIGELNIQAVYKSHLEGIARAADRNVTVKVHSTRSDRVPVETMVFGDWLCTPNSPSGEGDDETVTTAEGMYRKVAVFSARAA